MKISTESPFISFPLMKNRFLGEQGSVGLNQRGVPFKPISVLYIRKDVYIMPFYAILGCVFVYYCIYLCSLFSGLLLLVQ